MKKLYQVNISIPILVIAEHEDDLADIVAGINCQDVFGEFELVSYDHIQYSEELIEEADQIKPFGLPMGDTRTIAQLVEAKQLEIKP